MKKLLFFLCLLMSLLSCKEEENPSYSFLALGDSYTIGQGVEEAERWPNQLAVRLTERGINVRQPKIIARTGWSTAALKNAIEGESSIASGFDMVSLLIGVNNQFGGGSAEGFRPQFEELLQKSIELARGDTSRVFVLSIPDYGVTNFGMSRGVDVSAEIAEFNAVCREISAQYAVPFFDITPTSQLAANDQSLLAPDNLHPSGSMYKMWVDLIENDIASLLR